MIRILYFTAAWCAPCRRFGPMLHIETARRGLTVERIDVDADPGRAQAYQIASVPTVVAIRDGEVVDRFGVLPAPQLRERLDALTA